MSSESVSARALASRRNGARSRGPRTAAGKARSSRNALKHGLCAHKILVLPEEDAGAFRALTEALMRELAPVGALQEVLAHRIAAAAWRLARADRIEAEVLAERRYGDGGLGLAVIRDGNGTRSFDTVLRYRGAALAEFMRALKTLKALQAEACADLARPEVARESSPLARRRARPPVVQRSEPGQARQINGSTGNGAVERRPDASEPGPAAGPAMSPATAPGAQPPQAATPTQGFGLPASGRAQSDLRSDRQDISAAPLAAAKQTQEKTPAQQLGLRARLQSTSARMLGHAAKIDGGGAMA